MKSEPNNLSKHAEILCSLLSVHDMLLSESARTDRYGYYSVAEAVGKAIELMDDAGVYDAAMLDNASRIAGFIEAASRLKKDDKE